MKNKIKSKKKKYIIIFIVVVVLGGIVYTINKNVKEAMETVQLAMSSSQADEVSKRSLIKSIGATGTIVSVNKKTISADISNVDISKINVKVGDQVNLGDELVLFDISDYEKNLEDAQEALAKAQQRNSISSADLNRNLDDAQRTESYSISVAKKNMDDAYTTYSDLLKQCQDYVKASENFGKLEADAKVAYENALQTEAEKKAELLVSQGDAGAQAEYEQAVVATAEALKLYTNYGNEKEKAYTNAVNLNSSVVSALSAYENSKSSYENTIASQASSVAGAQSNKATTSLSLTTDAEVKQVENYESMIEDGVLVAPISGVVTSLSYEEGDLYTQGALLTIQDTSAFEITAYISEYDIADLVLNQQVIIKTNATGEEELQGKVIFISPTARVSTTSTEVSYEVTISIDTPNDRLRLDMSASLSIIIEQNENALTVPYNAIQNDEDGNAFVELINEDGTYTVQYVTVVMESNYYTQIQEGDIVEGQKVRIVDANTPTDVFQIMQNGGF